MKLERMRLREHLPPRAEMAEILAANGLALIFALGSASALALMLWTYWAQSVLLGIFNAARILGLKRFSAQGLKSNGKPVPETEGGKRSAGIFFAFHYGFFHFIYMMFLGSFASIGPEGARLGEGDRIWLAAACASFLIPQIGIWRRWREEDRAGIPNLGHLMFAPYVRIIPMHLTILFGAGMLALGAGWAAALLFAGLKTGADIAGAAIGRAMGEAARAKAIEEDGR